jgi:hypothetical protein
MTGFFHKPPSVVLNPRPLLQLLSVQLNYAGLTADPFPPARLPRPQYYGPMGKDWIFDNNGLNGAGPLGPP